MDLFESTVSQLGNFQSRFLSFSLLGILEIITILLIAVYVCTRTRASSLLWELVPSYLYDGAQGTYYLIINTGSNIFAVFGISGKTEDINPEISTGGHGACDLLRVTQHAGRKPYSSLLDWGIYFPFLAQCVRLKRFPYPQVSGNVLKDSRLHRAIKQATEEIFREKQKFHITVGGGGDEGDEETQPDDVAGYNKIFKSQQKRAYGIIMNMRSKISDILLRITSWILYKLLPCFLSGVVTHTKQIEMLKAATQRAPGVPLIFLPLHRSHLDYIMVSFILLNNDIRSPIVAAGNNLQIPVFGSLLRGLGAFFIKRKIDPIVGKRDTLYRAILHLYLTHALEAGHNLEFFIEGGRTRSGKPCMPKNGILSVIVNAFMDGTISDALLVPVSVNYERLVDGNFVREQLGQKKEPETFRSAIAGIWKALNSNYGLMRIDFNEPFSIKELVQSFNKIAREEGSNRIYKPAARQLQHNQSTSSLYGTDVVCEEHRSLVDSISRQVVYDCAVATSVMTTNAVSFLLLTRFRDGATEEELTSELDNLRQNLKGKRDIGFSGDSLHIVRYACDLLGKDLVSRDETDPRGVFIKPNLLTPNIIELTYYSNALTPHFALESIVVTALSALNAISKTEAVSRKKLKEFCLQHCEILRYEFILSKPTQNLDCLLDTTIDNLCSREISIFLEQEDTNEEVMQSRRLAQYIESSDDDDFYPRDNGHNYENPELYLADNEEIANERKAILNILAPISFSYYYVATCLIQLLGNSLMESEFIKIVLKEIRERVDEKECPFGESISTEYIKNCLKLLEKWSVIEITSSHGCRLLSLGSMYDSSTEIENIINRFSIILPQI